MNFSQKESDEIYQQRCYGKVIKMDKKKIKKQLTYYVEKLNDLLTTVQETYPDAEYYLATDVLCLMSGPSHDNDNNFNQKARRDRILAQRLLIKSGGGDW